MKCRMGILFMLSCLRSFCQTQACPVNINFATGDLTHWYAYTGNNVRGNGPTAIFARYDSTKAAPSGTIGVKSIGEYQLAGVQGIEVKTTNGTDPFGGFPFIPTINGYQYDYSIKLGSTSITRGNRDGTNSGGYIRGVSYSIHVPPGPVSEPYTMTYAYAMVLENGTHVSSAQPLISATLRKPDGTVITCASPSYLLPTFGNVMEGGRGALLDSATAKKNGFRVSAVRSPNPDPNSNNPIGEYLQDVWTKGWTEVTFDLAPYRGKVVSLTFEADNCVPGGHFAYGYIAIRNNCAGLMISGDSVVCNNSDIVYSVPALSGATYDWTIPASWTISSSDTSSIINVKSSTTGVFISVREKNSCADLTDTILVRTLPPPVGGVLNGSTEVCTDENSSVLNLTGYSGNIMNWLVSTDSVTWTAIADFNPQYFANNLTTTSLFRVLVGKDNVCPPDTSSSVTIQVDAKSVGGAISPAEATLCASQFQGQTLKLSGNTGAVQNWQYSTDGSNWSDFSPTIHSLTSIVKNITTSTQYRLIDKNGVCPPDTSTIAKINFVPVSFPQAFSTPPDTTICYGTFATLSTTIFTGTNYTWITGLAGTGDVTGTPMNITEQVDPKTTTDYILYVVNEGCPNPMKDTMLVNVLPPVLVDAGRDTSVVIGEPLQFNASSDFDGPDTFSWSPMTELNNPFIANPTGIYSSEDNKIKYTVTATTPIGCTGKGNITVTVFKTKPDIFVPNAFSPGLASNSLFRPIPVGITSLSYFRIYNRLGQLVYSTMVIGQGWNGMLNGDAQDAGAYVWMVKGTDYTGNVITKNGTMVLVR